MWRLPRANVVSFSLALAVVSVTTASGEQRYTPRQVWSDQREAAQFEDWFSRQLRAMGEPSLWQLSFNDKSARVFRVLELPTFSPATGARLVIRADGSGEVHVTRLDGAGAYAPGKVSQRTEEVVSSKKVDDFIKLIDRNDFWTKPTSRRNPHLACFDGTWFLFEFLSLGNYKLVSRHECAIEKEVLEILLAFPAEYAADYTAPPVPDN